MIVNFKKILADFDADGDGRLSRDEAPFLLKARRGNLEGPEPPVGVAPYERQSRNRRAGDLFSSWSKVRTAPVAAPRTLNPGLGQRSSASRRSQWASTGGWRKLNGTGRTNRRPSIFPLAPKRDSDEVS